MLRVAPLAALLAACSTVPAPTAEPPIREIGSDSPCRDIDSAPFVGKAATSTLGESIRKASGATALRWIPTGAAVTMDYRTDRVNVRLDRSNRVESISCG